MAHIAGMMNSTERMAGRGMTDRASPARATRGVALAVAAISGAALFAALASEWWGGLVPCALCLWERWPYRVLIALGLLATVLPPRVGRWVLAVAVFAGIAGSALGFVHVGVEHGWWPSPLPECAAPNLGGGSIAERLARMPAAPSKACDEPTYLIPGLPVSMAAMNMVLATALTLAVIRFLATSGATRRDRA